MKRLFGSLVIAASFACAGGNQMLWVAGKSGSVERLAMAPDGKLTAVDTVQIGKNPSFAAIDPVRRIAYVADEDAGAVLAYSFDAKGALKAFGPTVETQGGPAHIALRAGRVFVANYNEGTVLSFALAVDGSLVPGAAQTLSPGKNAHQVAFDPTGKLAYVPCLGSDHIAHYTVHEGVLTENGVVTTATGAGPRHLAFHPVKPFAFGLNELDSTLQVYAIAADGKLSPSGAPVSMLPGDFTGKNSGAEIYVSQDGRFVYASNRGHDSIVTFAIDPSSGALSSPRFTPVGGARPRHFIVDSTGKWLVAAHEGSGTVAVFSITPEDGALKQVADSKVGLGPQYVDFVP